MAMPTEDGFVAFLARHLAPETIAQLDCLAGDVRERALAEALLLSPPPTLRERLKLN